jgi:DNA-binding transcriptional LysR family regulator
MSALRVLDMRRLQTLDRVAARSSFSLAAEELHFTQSAVSQQIATLERDLGLQLVNRSPVSLTPPGRMLRDRYASALAELAAAEAELDSFREGGSGRLRIAAVGAAAVHVIPRAVAAFAARFPAVAVHVEQHEAAETIARLKRGEADIALSFGFGQPAEKGPRVRSVRLTRERICIAVPASHPLSRKADASLAELRGERFLHSPSGGLPLEGLAEAVGAPINPSLVFAGDNPDAVHAMVAQGAGLALVSELDRQHVPGVEHVRLVDPPLTRSIYAATLDSERTSATVGAMLDELVASARRAASIGLARGGELPRPVAVRQAAC